MVNFYWRTWEGPFRDNEKRIRAGDKLGNLKWSFDAGKEIIFYHCQCVGTTNFDISADPIILDSLGK